MLIKPIEIQVKDLDGNERTYLLGRFPAVEGLEIIAQVPSNVASLSKQLPNLKGLVVQMGKFIAISTTAEDGTPREINLTTQAMIDNHIPDSETLLRVLFELMRHNTSFFGKSGQSILDYLVEKLAAFKPKIIQTLSPWLQQLSAKDSQR